MAKDVFNEIMTWQDLEANLEEFVRNPYDTSRNPRGVHGNPMESTGSYNYGPIITWLFLSSLDAVAWDMAISSFE